MVHLDNRDNVIRWMFTGFLKKFFRFSLAGGVVRVALPGRTLPTLSLSSPVKRICSQLLKILFNLRVNDKSLFLSKKLSRSIQLMWCSVDIIR